MNFDAKVRRESFEPIDLFHAHVGGMDAFALGLKLAARIRADGVLKKAYEKLRPLAKGQVEAATPRLGQLLDEHAEKTV